MTVNLPRPAFRLLWLGVVSLLSGCSLASLESSDAPLTPLIVAAETQPVAPPVTAPAPAAPAFAAAPPQEFSPGIGEIVKLARAGVGEDVLLAFIAGTKVEYHPTAGEIVYLNDLGVSEKVMAALIRRPVEAEQVAKSAPQPVEPSPAPQPGPVPALPPADTAPPITTAAPTTVVVEQPVLIEQPQTIAVEAPEQDLAVVRHFWPSLEPFGAWVRLNQYGWCWQPTVARYDPHWRPYCDRGRWVFTDCGWYWLSDYSWGWAPFHYGRWFQHSSQGWCWTPDTVWSSAWVSWRSSAQYAGWAPLPPAASFHVGVGFSSHIGVDFGLHWSHYTFLPVHQLCDASPVTHRLRGNQVNAAYSQSTVINNFHYGSGDIVINRGLPVDRYAAATGETVPAVNVRNLTGNARPDQLHRDGESLLVYRPRLSQLPLAASTADIDRSRNEVRKPTAATLRSGTTGTSHAAPASLADTRRDEPVGRTTRPDLGSQLPRAVVPTTAAPATSALTSSILSSSQASPSVPSPSSRHGRQEAVKPQFSTRSPSTVRTGVHGIRPAPGVETLSAPQPLTSAPQVPGVETRPLSPPQPITSVLQAPGVDTRPLTPPQPRSQLESQPSPFQRLQPAAPASPPQTIRERSFTRPSQDHFPQSSPARPQFTQPAPAPPARPTAPAVSSPDTGRTPPPGARGGQPFKRSNER